MFKLPFRPPTLSNLTSLRSISLLSTLFGATTTNMSTSTPDQPSYNVRPYTPTNPTGPLPYSKQDLTPMDPGNDASFYGPPRFVTHIDDGAIIGLKRYYDTVLPRKGVILDFCSSWISHYPPSVFNAAAKRGEHRSRGEAEKEAGDGEGLVVLGTGMNQAELAANPVLLHYTVQDLNENPSVTLPGPHNQAPSSTSPSPSPPRLNASTCVVSIDYLTNPVSVLSSIRSHTVTGGTVHLAISNRCFPTKVVGRWLKIDEHQRLEMVGDYLWWAGWRGVEIVEVVKGGWLGDPLWVVRATNEGEGGDGESGTMST